jgi:acyl carrier protein
MLDHSDVDFDLREKVVDLVDQLLRKRSSGRQVLAEDDLREIGLTSLDLVSLMLAVEAKFSIQIPDIDMTPANFRSIWKIEEMIAALRLQT